MASVWRKRWSSGTVSGSSTSGSSRSGQGGGLGGRVDLELAGWSPLWVGEVWAQVDTGEVVVVEHEEGCAFGSWCAVEQAERRFCQQVVGELGQTLETVGEEVGGLRRG